MSQMQITGFKVHLVFDQNGKYMYVLTDYHLASSVFYKHKPNIHVQYTVHD